jgi:hypothetical protein
VPSDPLALPIAGVLVAPDVAPAEIERAAAEALFRPALVTPPVPFDYTSYYDREMGKGLSRFWLAGGALLPAADLAAWKLAARRLEDRWRRPTGGRRVNCDPGYLNEWQLVLATAKPLPQAVYLRDGVFALLELLFRQGAFEVLPWTYPDYAAAAAAGAFLPFRRRYLELKRAAKR